MKQDYQVNTNMQPIDADEIDLKKIFNLILRNKYFISSITLFFFILFCVVALSKKRIWEGQFQIVLRSNQELNLGNKLGMESELSDVAGLMGLGLNLGTGGSSLNTEVGILESPSVLMPVFEIFKDDKTKLNPRIDIPTFENWKKDSLKVDLKKGTSILDISYRDTNKKLIIPVLRKMTEVYQDYSGKGKRRGLKLTKLFLDRQILDYKSKSFKSIKLAQDYAIDQDLTVLDLSNNLILKQGQVGSNANNNNTARMPSTQFIDGFGDNTSIEVARVMAANLIRQIDIQISKIEKLSDDNDDLQYINLILPTLTNEGLPQDLKALDLTILEMRSKYTDNFEPLLALEEKRRLVVKLLKKRAIGILKAQRISAESRMESAKRPKDVLLKYKELIREAKRDEMTLIQLENLLRHIQLEEAKIEDPWELITKPNLKEKPVGPRRTYYGLAGIIFGYIFSMGIAYLKEKKSDMVFEQKELKSLFNIDILEEVPFFEGEDSKNYTYLENILKLSANKEIYIANSKCIDNSKLKQIKNQLKSKSNKINFLEDYNTIYDNQSIFLLVSIPCITYKEVKQILKRMDINNNKVIGILLI